MNIKVLFVDDDANIREAVQRTLRKYFTLEVAADGAEALARMETDGPFAVLITDLKMPGMSGHQLLEQAEARWPDTVRIMMSGDLQALAADDAVKKGRVFCFLAKPCAPTPLIETIEAGLARHRILALEREMAKEAAML